MKNFLFNFQMGSMNITIPLSEIELGETVAEVDSDWVGRERSSVIHSMSLPPTHDARTHSHVNRVEMEWWTGGERSRQKLFDIEGKSFSEIIW